MILTVNKTIDSLEGRGKMSSAEKFEAFKQQQVQQNEENMEQRSEKNMEKILFGNPMRR